MKKCWADDPLARYQSVNELRASFSQVFDLMLRPSLDALSKSQELVEEIETKFDDSSLLIRELIPLLQSLIAEDFRNVSTRMRTPFINKFLANSSTDDVSSLIKIYGSAFREGHYSFELIDPVADAMLAIFETGTTTLEHKVEAFELNLYVAKKCGRYHAERICVRMLSITNDDLLALQLVPYLTPDRASFLCRQSSSTDFSMPRIRQAMEALCPQ